MSVLTGIKSLTDTISFNFSEAVVVTAFAPDGVNELTKVGLASTHCDESTSV